MEQSKTHIIRIQAYNTLVLHWGLYDLGFPTL